MLQSPIRRTRNGDYKVRLSAQERDLLRSLPDQIGPLLSGDDPSVRRLFPAAYGDDPDRDAEYHRLMHEDLVEHHRHALAVLAHTVDAERLTADELQGWMAALNDARLVLGTTLDVGEELDLAAIGRDDPRAPGLAVYGYLSWLLEVAVDASASAL